MCTAANTQSQSVKVIRNGCRSIWCPECGSGQGRKLRERLVERYRVNRVRQIGFVTLTCSPAILGADLEEQFHKVKDDRLVSRFARELNQIIGSKVPYFAVMEFHHKSQQIHFHLLFDNLGKLNKKQLKELQDWCQDHMGTMDYKFRSTDTAVGYAVKYLTKGSHGNLPEWCLDYEGRIRPYTTSHGFWHDSKPRRRSEPTGKTHKERTLRYRIENCGDAGVIVIEESAAKDGECIRRFRLASPVRFDEWRATAMEVVDSELIEEISRCVHVLCLDPDEFREVGVRVGAWAVAAGQAAKPPPGVAA